MQTDMHWVYSPHIVRYEKMSDNFRRLKLSKCFPKLIFLRQNSPEQSVTNSLPPFGDCDVNAAVRQLPLYDLAIDKRSYISTNSYSFYQWYIK